MPSFSDFAGRPALSRRRFMARGFSTLSAAALVPGNALGPSVLGADIGEPVSPALVGPHYFDEAERRALAEVMDQGAPFRFWGRGEPVQARQFEEAFTRRMGSRFALGVTSGTAALDCAMAAVGVGPGDEVVVPAYTWWSDYTCVVQAGALPVFADIDDTLNLDPRDFQRRITPRTRAVIAVHLLGGACDLEPILAVAQRQGIAVVEDCAQCVGGSLGGRPLGSMGAMGIYSFQVNKMITSGEGGAVVTQDPALYERAVRFHDMGSFRSLFETRTGGVQGEMYAGENFRMSELTAAVLNGQLPKLDRMVADLRRHAGRVTDGIRDLPGMRLRRQPDAAGDIGTGVFFQLANRGVRDRCIQALRQRGVPASTLSGSVLLPMEDSVRAKRARHPAWPSWATSAGQAMVYGPESCPGTLGVFDRFVQVRIGPNYTERVDDYLVSAIREVWGGLS